jgi:hypothetical protein
MYHNHYFLSLILEFCYESLVIIQPFKTQTFIAGHDTNDLRTMCSKFCCFAFSNEDEFETYKNGYGEFDKNKFTNTLYANEFALQGVCDLPNEIIVEYLFPLLGTHDIRNLGDVGDTRLKCLAEDYLGGSKCIHINKNTYCLLKYCFLVRSICITMSIKRILFFQISKYCFYHTAKAR